MSAIENENRRDSEMEEVSTFAEVIRERIRCRGRQAAAKAMRDARRAAVEAYLRNTVGICGRSVVDRMQIVLYEAEAELMPKVIECAEKQELELFLEKFENGQEIVK